MITLFSLRELESLSTGVLIRAEAEYSQAYRAARCHKAFTESPLCLELERSLTQLRTELRSRGIETTIRSQSIAV